MDGLPLLDIDCIWHYGEKLATCDRTLTEVTHFVTCSPFKREKIIKRDKLTNNSVQKSHSDTNYACLNVKIFSCGEAEQL